MDLQQEFEFTDTGRLQAYHKAREAKLRELYQAEAKENPQTYSQWYHEVYCRCGYPPCPLNGAFFSSYTTPTVEQISEVSKLKFIEDKL